MKVKIPRTVILSDEKVSKPSRELNLDYYIEFIEINFASMSGVLGTIENGRKLCPKVDEIIIANNSKRKIIH